MCAVTVRHILNLLVPRGARLIAGEQGLCRKVTWAITMRTRPPAFEAPSGGELALLSLSALRSLQLVDNLVTLDRIVHDLHEAEVAAVAVAGSEPLPTSAVALAERLGLPLIHLPQGAPLSEIERDVISHVVNQRGELERQAGEIYHALLALNIQGEGAPAIAEHLAQLTGRTVVVEDERRTPLLCMPAPESGLNRERVIALLEGLPDACVTLEGGDGHGGVYAAELSVVARQRLGDGGLARFVAPIQLKHEIAGYLSLIGDDAALDSLDRMVVAQAAAIFALAFAREREVAAVEQRLRGDVVDDLFAGNYAAESQIIQRAAHLGLDLTLPYVIAVAEPDDLSSDGPTPLSALPLASGWGRRLADEVERSFPGAWLRRTTGERSGREQAILLLPMPAQGRIALVLERLRALQHRLATGAHSLRFSIGVGRPYDGLDGLRRAFREAGQALEMGRRLFGPSGLTYFGDLGIYRLLFRLQDTEELAAFYAETLGPLVEYDRHTDGQLLHTLEVYFACHTNLSEAARVLHLHRNSLLYRLQRIEEVLGTSLADADTSLSLQVALRIRRTLRQE